MRKEFRVVFLSVFCLVIVAAVCALPPAQTQGTDPPKATHEQTAAAAQSVSGKIASVEKSSFTLTVAPDRMSKLSQQMQEPAPKTMTFSIDRNTTVDGKLQVGANADVTYREDNGRNIAISVRVS
jgi:hypothetical protein